MTQEPNQNPASLPNALSLESVWVQGPVPVEMVRMGEAVTFHSSR